MPVEMTRVDPDLSRTETQSRDDVDALVLQYLRSIANPRGIAAASNRDLAVALPMSAATARRSVARLIEAGDMDLVSRGTGGRYVSRFRVHALIATPAA